MTVPYRTKRFARQIREVDQEGGAAVVEFYRDARGPNRQDAPGYPCLFRLRRQDGEWGFWRIERTIRGDVYRFSTGCYRLEAAVAIYAQFEADPARTFQRIARTRGSRIRMKPAVHRYLRYLEKVRQVRPRTLKSNRTILLRFARACPVGPHHVTADGLQDYISELGEHYALSTIDLHWRMIRAFLRWCSRRRYSRRPPIDEVFVPKNDKPPRASGRVLLEANDIRRLLEHAQRDWVRHAIVVLWGCGLRIGELWLIRPRHLYNNGTELGVPESKARGRWYKRLPVTDPQVRESIEFIAEWNTTRASISRVVRVLNQEIEAMCEATGIERFSPKSLRMSAICRWVSEGCAESDIAQWVGHHAVSVMRRYYMHEDRRAVKLPGPVL